ncbi:MAG: phage holin family protein [Solirubrobacterales bacterium]|nr:phage holin family protein [Solirubrobacterales bacterium]
MPNGNGNTALREEQTGDLVKELSEQTALLVRQEVELAKAELKVKTKQAGVGVGMFGAAGTAGLFVLGGLMAAAILGLSTVFTPWLAALVITAALAVVAGVAVVLGRSKVRRATPPVPEQTTESVKEDLKTARTRAQGGHR